MAATQGDSAWGDVLKFLEPKPPLFCPEEPTLKQKIFLRSEALEVLYGGRAGGGKGVQRTTPIITPFGSRLAQDIKVGDQVSNPDGSVSRVVAVHTRGWQTCWRVVTSDGAEIVCDNDHLWLVRKSGRSLKRDLDWRVMTAPQLATAVAQSLDQVERGVRPNWPMIPLTEPVEFTIPTRNSDARWPIDPYILGVLLGDGHLGDNHNSVTVSSADREIVNAVHVWATTFGLNLVSNGPYGYRLTSVPAGPVRSRLRLCLEQCGLYGARAADKAVPTNYLLSPLVCRSALIQGLMDTDGYADARGHASFTSISKQLATDVQWIGRSLGFKATMSEKVGQYKRSDRSTVLCHTAYTVTFTGRNARDLFRLERKRSRCSEPQQTAVRRVVSMERTADQETICFTVDNPNGLFIAGDGFVVSHNSSALLMGALQYVDIPGYAAMIFRNTFSDLNLPGALMDRSHDWFDDIPDVHWAPNSHRWTFPSGATLTFGYLEKPLDHLRYKSAEFQYIGMDEVSEIREKHYRYLFSRLRRPSGKLGRLLAKVPLRMRSASNPAPNWVRRRFLEEGEKAKRLYVPAGLDDNPYVDHITYRRVLAELDPVERARLERGDWYAEESGSKFKRDWFPIVGPDALPAEFDKMVRYWDLAATLPSEKNPDPDWTVGTLVGLKNGRLYILDMVRDRLEPADVEDLVLRTAEMDGPFIPIRMEQEPASGGKNTVSNYARFVLLGFDFDGHPTVKDKEARADLWAAKAKRREVIVKRGPYVTDMLDELSGFPESSPHDDIVDTISGAYEHLTGLGQKVRRRLEIIV